MRRSMEIEKKSRVAVVVLGNVGRSPRMQYHALSLAQQVYVLHPKQDLHGLGSDPHIAVKENQSIHLHTMRLVDFHGLSKISKVLALLFKAAIQFVILVWFLCFKIRRPDVFIVQNLASVPTFSAVKLSSWNVSGLRNFLGEWQLVPYVLQRPCSMNLLRTGESIVLYDQPPEIFHPASLKEKHELFCRLQSTICHPNGIWDCISIASENRDDGGVGPSSNTLFTVQTDSNISLKPNRPVLVVSSTSWTPDEDFSLLLEAALKYDRYVSAALNEDDLIDEKRLWSDMKNGHQFLYPRLLFIITGKGPERSKYEEQIKKLKLRLVAFRTMWLSAEDYPLLLGSADLGVCLHTSSSGLDLPMKVVDMFGCGLPVCAVSFSCIEELVKVEQNGLLFLSSSELADQFMMLFKGFLENCDNMKSLRDGALAIGSSRRWSTKWETHALPLIREVLLGQTLMT